MAAIEARLSVTRRSRVSVRLGPVRVFGGPWNKMKVPEFERQISVEEAVMLEFGKRLSENDKTLVAAAALIVAGVMAIGMPPYILFFGG